MPKAVTSNTAPTARLLTKPIWRLDMLTSSLKLQYLEPIRITPQPAHPHASAGGMGMPSYGYSDRHLVYHICPGLSIILKFGVFVQAFYNQSQKHNPRR
jgi:hypothetical protein